MTGKREDPPRLTATFTPGGLDDYYLPTSPDVVHAPAPQRFMQELPGQITDNLKAMELDGSGDKSRQRSLSPNPASRISSTSSTPRIPPLPAFGALSSVEPQSDPFPKLSTRTSNVPPSDQEKSGVLDNARLPVLASSDPEVQLMWAQDALTFADITTEHLARLSHITGTRPSTPTADRQVRTDAVSIVGFLADQHHPKAEFLKGMWLEFGKFGYAQDRVEAFRSYKRAVERGYARAEYRMGMMFESTNQSHEALTHYRAGEAAGDAASCYRLGMSALLGQLGQTQDFVRAITLIRHSADHADENAPQGAYVFGMLLASELPQIQIPERYLPPDPAAARIYLERAAFLGFSKAQLRMGSAYELCSLGCEFNPALSIHYNRLAARQGEIEAEMAISKWFLCGYEGVFPKNEEIAYTYAERASSDGLATAEFAMGYFHEIGMYVPVNFDKALHWYRKAAQNGSKDAETRIEQVSMHRTLSKKDHEQIAVKRIQSTHASRRGSRPVRLPHPQQPSLPAVPDDYHGRASFAAPAQTLPPVQAAPYPPDGEPRPMSTPAAPYPAGPGSRPNSTAPYPAGSDYRSTVIPRPDDLHPRPSSVAASSSARMPNRGPPGGRPVAPYPQAAPVTNRPPPAQRVPASGGRVLSGPLEASGAGGPAIPPKGPIGVPGLRVDSRQDSYNGPPPADPARAPRTPDFSARPPQTGSRVSSAGPSGRGQSPAGPGNAAWTSPSAPQMSSAIPSSTAERPAFPNALSSQTIRIDRKPSKGPATFDEMGIPKAKGDGDCSVM